jgi:hypothetical protein
MTAGAGSNSSRLPVADDNVLAHDGRLTGIIDWDGACWAIRHHPEDVRRQLDRAERVLDRYEA